MRKRQERPLTAEARFEVVTERDGERRALVVEGTVATVSAYTTKAARLRARQRFGNHVDVAQAA